MLVGTEPALFTYETGTENNSFRAQSGSMIIDLACFCKTLGSILEGKKERHWSQGGFWWSRRVCLI